ncbi:MAG: UDP-N-acetylmuramate: L-alanyl-gamma-D-glutamyl-meso-diaminopimelate ligase, partial [Myxococcota bacterium]
MSTTQADRCSPETLNSARRVHIMGVGGSAMGTFAGMLTAQGIEVRGSDAGCYPPMSDLLAGWGIEVMVGYRAENLDWNPDLVIVGNVIRAVNPEAVAMRDRGIPHVSFPEAFAGKFLEGRHSIVISGTHGKTTTTSLTAWLLEHAELAPGVLVGGVPRNFGTSFRLGEGDHFVVEGDEYDTAYFDKVPKFLHYRPRTAVITNIEFDHADIYPDVDAIEREFVKLVALLPADGRLLYYGGCERATRVAQQAPCPAWSYGVGLGDWQANNLVVHPGGTRFTVSSPLGDFEIDCPLFGEHNIQNALAALAIARLEGVSVETLIAGLLAFKNVKKRHEVKGIEDGVTVIDDFAHHPTAVRETVRAVRERYPQGRLWCCFEVESNTSRRRIFQDAYPPAFDGADAVLFCKPHEKADNLPPDERISLTEVSAALEARGIEAHLIEEVADIVDWLASRVAAPDVVLGMSGRHFHG